MSVQTIVARYPQFDTASHQIHNNYNAQDRYAITLGKKIETYAERWCKSIRNANGRERAVASRGIAVLEQTMFLHTTDRQLATGNTLAVDYAMRLAIKMAVVVMTYRPTRNYSHAGSELSIVSCGIGAALLIPDLAEPMLKLFTASLRTCDKYMLETRKPIDYQQVTAQALLMAIRKNVGDTAADLAELTLPQDVAVYEFIWRMFGDGKKNKLVSRSYERIIDRLTHYHGSEADVIAYQIRLAQGIPYLRPLGGVHLSNESITHFVNSNAAEIAALRGAIKRGR